MCKFAVKRSQFLLITKFQAAIMSSIITAVFKATIGWLVDKSRDEAAKKLKDGDVTDQKLRGIIMREIDEIKSRLDGLARKDLLASISFFREGIERLYDVFEDTRGDGADTERMKDLEPELSKSARRKLTRAKKRFEFSLERATDAFSNEALSPNDRILAMLYRVMATALESIDHPKDVVAPCKVFIKELNGLPVVQQSLKEQLKTGIRVKGLFNKNERLKLISSVCLVNRVAYDVTQTVLPKEPLPQWPMIDTGKEKVDLLRDRRVTKILCEQGMENCSVPWILGHDGEEENRLNVPGCIATNSSGHCLVKDDGLTIKVFDNSGKFVQRYRLPLLIDGSLVDLATDKNNNIYALVEEESSRERWIFKFNRSVEQHHRFRVRAMEFDFDLCKLSVSDSDKVVVLKGAKKNECSVVDVYETDGQFVCSFGRQILSYSYEITAVSDGRVMVVEKVDPSRVHIFSEQGDHLHSFNLEKDLRSLQIAYHRESEQVVIAGVKGINSDILYIEIDTNDSKLMRSTSIHFGEFIWAPLAIAVTSEGRIAVSILFQYMKTKVIII